MKRNLSLLLGALAAVLWLGPRASAQDAATGAGPAVLLKTESPWRVFCTWKTEMVRWADGEIGPVKVRVGRSKFEPKPVTRTDLPPAGWAAADFDDSGWARFYGPIPDGSRELALMCLRGRFAVADPAKASDLTLSLAYRGGVVVHLNGREIARGHVGKGGEADEADVEALAEDYPADAYVDADGQLLRRGFGDPEKYPDRFAIRTRRLEAVKIPASQLVRGTNVLAVELHRAPTAEVLITGKSKTMMSFGASYSQWSMLGLEDLQLAAADGALFQSNIARPVAPEVFTADVATRLLVSDYPDILEPVRPMHVAGCRNGSFSAQMVLSFGAAIHGLSVSCSPLKQEAGDAILPADCVQIRYALPDGQAYRQTSWFSGLAESAPAEVPASKEAGGAMQPVWLTVHVPADAKAGTYRGTVRLESGTWQFERWLILDVADWTLPDAKDFRTHVGLIQSPESEALQYDVPLWSEAHWKLIDRSFARMAVAGADDVFITALRRTPHGNEHGMIRWIRQPDGGWKHDFSIAARYLDTALEHLGKAEMICLYLWDRQGGGWMNWGTRHFEQTSGPPITILDPATGKLSEGEGPKWGTPEARDFWRPVVEQFRKLLAERGVEKSLMFGVALDARPPKETIEDLKAIAPDVPWVLHSHQGPDNIHGQPVGYGAHVHISPGLFDPAVRRSYGWQDRYIFTAFPRYGCGGAGPLHGQDLALHRVGLEGFLVSGHRGFGRVGADFWPVLGKPGRKSTVYCRYGTEQVSIQIDDSEEALLAPGRDGPIGTVCLEMLRENAQECEARIFLERALLDAASRERLGEPLATRCQQLLDARVHKMLWAAVTSRMQSGFLTNWALWPAMGWQADSRALYQAAAEAAAKLEPRGSITATEERL